MTVSTKRALAERNLSVMNINMTVIGVSYSEFKSFTDTTVDNLELFTNFKNEINLYLSAEEESMKKGWGGNKRSS